LALSREEKVERVAQYAEQLEGSQGIILVDYRGLTVSEMEEIRNEMRPMASQFQVVKNRLLNLALKEKDMSLPDDWLTGPTAVSFCRDEVPPVAKALVEAGKETETLALKGGWMNESLLTAEQVKSIAELPSREVLLAQVLGAINGPSRQVAGVVASGVRQVLNVLQAYVDKLEEEGAGGAVEAAAEPA
jgi:large subunit ribosomal protein L10